MTWHLAAVALCLAPHLLCPAPPKPMVDIGAVVYRTASACQHVADRRNKVAAEDYSGRTWLSICEPERGNAKNK